MNPLNWLPALFDYFERFCIKIATKGWHKPGFYLSTLFTAPVALYLHRKETHYTGLNVLLKVLANILLVFSLYLLINGFFLFLILLPIARIIKFIYNCLRIGEKVTEPMRWNLTFQFEKLDLLALLFILFIFLGFLVNAYRITPTGPDCWYHMAVARKIMEHGEIPLWDTWEFQWNPAVIPPDAGEVLPGRPHLYPPLLHILIALFSPDAEHIIEGAKVLQIILYPAALFTSWYFARLLFSSKVAFIAVIVLSMDITFSIIFIGLMPSSLVNLLFPLVLMGFLSKRLVIAVPTMVLCLYSHLSFPFLVLICLFILSYKYRTYFSFYKKFLVLSLVLYLPWALRIFFFRDFLRSFGAIVGNPIAGIVVGMLSLQILNPILLYCGIQGLRKSSGITRDIVKYILIGFLPALIFYGGRYWFHTAPFWAIFIALFLKKWITSKKGIALILFFSLVPLPLVALNIPKGGPPVMLSITAVDSILGLQFWPSSYYDEDRELEAILEQYTAPDQIIHVDEGSLADKIVVLTGRPVDNGMWFEVGSGEIQRRIEYNRLHERPAVFVYFNRDELPPVDEVYRIGRYWVAVRT